MMITKIVHIIPTLALGGAERLVVDLCVNLPRESFACLVITTVAGGPLEEELKNVGIAVVHLDSLIRKPARIKLILWLQRVRALIAFLRQESPAILHTHLTSADIIGWYAGRQAGVRRIVSTEHNINNDEKKWQTFLKKMLARAPVRLVCLSEAIKKYAARVYNFPEKKLQVIYDGVDIQKFAPARFSRADGVADSSTTVDALTTPAAASVAPPSTSAARVPQITCVARLEPQKGHETLLRALALLDDLAWELVLVGEGSLRAYLMELACVLNIRERVNYLGARQDITAILRDTDIFVLPSLWEGLGIVVLEAGAAAVPVIASRVGGIPEMIIDKETGLLVPPGDTEALSHALRELLQNPARAREMGDAARARVEQRFALTQTIEKYQMLYESLM